MYSSCCSCSIIVAWSNLSLSKCSGFHENNDVVTPIYGFIFYQNKNNDNNETIKIVLFQRRLKCPCHLNLIFAPNICKNSEVILTFDIFIFIIFIGDNMF